ncbi:TonB-dependent receptor domain-containing protein [Novosphingobium mangrovi (ex Hu et al. 2023)]|uniref:TonB-dependent receptor n=1 Tax=Novosphingobium mangrovi (ex Hu et al. 2023) TaxID=2930094 RepID=A0ABT0ADZ4_9SPHN|nr:TonB-dependent receptor [Novosphingobium mangrovi (ex Hu et al. 2023)]MCJ1961406.1 TonB-dependent receptor [Novosphingobium mangrovi (ex Hu et al. 2023)]
MDTRKFPRLGITLRRAMLGAAALSISSTAFAQSGTPDETLPQSVGNEPAGEAIIVTGSRIAASGFSAPTPITALDQEQLIEAAPSTMADALRTLPALTNTSGPQSNSGTTNGGQSFLNLRSLGRERTLTLLDGRRMVPSALTGSVDANLIPSALIQRVDIVTGGASAAYGSDAVAGVVNFVVDKRFEGVKLDAHYGLTEHGDNKEFKATGAYGTSFADGRGHFEVAGEYYDTKGVEPIDRKWSRQGNTFINGPAGGPTRIISSDVLSVGTVGGMILNGNGGTADANAALGGIQFLPDGSMAPYDFGSYRAGSQQIGGDGVNTELYQALARPMSRLNFYGRTQYELAPEVTLFAEGLFGRSRTTYANGANRHQIGNPLTIQADNAFLPDEIRDQMLDTGVTSLTFLRHSRDRGLVTTRNNATTYRIVAGAEGDVSGWHWEAYYQRGQSKQDNDIFNMENVPRFLQAVDAVESNGQIVCRSSLANPANGCVPFNPFGANAPSEAALDYVLGTSHSVSKLTMDNFALNASGTLFEGWAGPISAAVGAEYRKERANVTSDIDSQNFAWIFGNPQPWSGGYSVKEAFLELQAPLLRDVAFAQELDINGAVRVTDYSTSGSIASWKAGFSWVPFEGLRIRGTRSRDIRAANVNELFSAGRQFTASVTDPFNNNVLVRGIPNIAGGNPDLRPEIANTLTLGAVIQPIQVPGLSMSVDFYNIKIRNAIVTITPQQVVDQCFGGNDFACNLTERDAGGNLTTIFGTPINLSSQQARGLDFEVSYRTSVGDLIGPDTQLSVRTLASYLDKLENVVPGSPPIDRAGEVGLNGTPHWGGNMQMRLSSETLGFFMQGRLIGGGAYDNTRTSADLSLTKIDPIFYLDTQISYKLPVLDRGVELFLDVRNLLDKDPPIAPAAANIAMATNSSVYDLVGRNFRFGVRVRY